MGGAPRDLLLGFEVPDVDVAVEGADPYEVARALETRAIGTAVPLSDEAPRVARVAGARELDLAAVEGGGIAADLARRDFTANAIAISISRTPLEEAWIDPSGGIRDIAERRLRIVSEANLRDDPLRAWRAARLYATRGLVPDRRSTDACSRAAALLPQAAPERIRVELEKLLAAHRVRPALGWSARAGLLGGALGIALSRPRAIRIAGESSLDSPRVLRRPPAGRVVLRLALLAAACGLDGAAAASWLASRRFSREAARCVGTLVLLASRAASPGSPRARWEWVRDAGENARDAILLARLLHPDPRSRAAIDAHGHAARSRRRPPRVGGEDVLAWLGIPPGPDVGEWLREIEVEGLRGAIRSRAQARRWLLARGKTARTPSGRAVSGPAGL